MQNGMLIGGAAKRLYVMDYGLFQVHENGRVIGICGYLIQTDTGGNILIDTGFPPHYAEDFEAASLADGLGSFGRILTLDHRNLPAGQLATIGLKPADIDLLIMTHSHIDHVGGIGDFPQAPIVIGGPERRLDRPLYFGDARPVAWPADAEYIIVEEDRMVCEGVQLLMTPGHSPGHMSLIVDLPETGTVVVAADAISRPAEIDEKFAGSWNEALAIESAEGLMRIAAECDGFVIYGHGPEQWPTLRKAPDCYG